MHKKYINVFVEIDVILGLYDLKSHIKYTHNTHSQTLAAMRLGAISMNGTEKKEIWKMQNMRT